jgi:hypothetical protein
VKKLLTYTKAWLRLLLTIVIISQFFIVEDIRAQDINKEWLIKKFIKLDLAINNGEGYSNYTNKDGALAWAESYLLESYLDMYLATKDINFIEKFVQHAEKVVNNTDKARNVKDYKGKSRIGWSATKYTVDNKPMIFLVHSAMITYPLAKFSLIVKNDKNLNKYSEIANKFLNLTIEAIKEFDPQFRYDEKTGEGNYWWEGDEPLKTDLKAPPPFNYSLSAGRVFVLLYKITKEKVYLDKATSLAKYFKHNLILTEDNAYLWGYRADIKKFPAYEDISHGGIDLDFAILCAENGIIFDENDMKRFVNTLLRVKKVDDGFFNYVNRADILGENSNIGGKKADLSFTIGRWLELSQFDCSAYKVIAPFLFKKINNSEKEHPIVLLGLAKLIKYYNECKKNKKFIEVSHERQ